jgi:hypothetical protein
LVDFKVVDVPGMLSVPVKSFDENGMEVPDDGEWHRHTALAQYVLAELLVGKQLVENVSAVERHPALAIMWSQLTSHGQAFVRAASDQWLRSVDRIGTTETTMVQKLERRWRTFSQLDAS